MDSTYETRSSEDVGNYVIGNLLMSFPINKGIEEFLRLHKSLVGHGCYIMSHNMIYEINDLPRNTCRFHIGNIHGLQ